MTSIREAVRRQFEPVKSLTPGLFTYVSPPSDPRNFRLHLRIEADGSGVLILNGSTILHLNQTATEYAYQLVQGASNEQAARAIASRYRVSVDKAGTDFREFIDRLQALINTPDLDPVTFLEFDRQQPYSGEIISPYRLDCALTYRSEVDESYQAVDRTELTTDEWITVFDKAWSAWIPHVFFTGGEPTLRDDLIQLISHAGSNGQITGLATFGQRLAEPAFLNNLLQTGLDHLLILLHSAGQENWAAIQNSILADIFLTVHITISRENQSLVEDHIKRLKNMGLSSISLSAASQDYRDKVLSARDLAASLGLSLVWDLPVPHSRLDAFKIEMEGREYPKGPGRAWLYVEPTGDVRPGQGREPMLGNFLHDPWETIWQPSQNG